VVEAGQASVDGHVATAGGWAALVAAMIVAGGLWWLYFDSAVEINLRVLELSGGSPTMARAIFAVGHQLPAFALLITAAGIGLLLEEDPPAIAAKLACFGIAIYLASTRSFLELRGRRRATILRVLVLLATFALWRLEEPLGPPGVRLAPRRLGRRLRGGHDPARPRGRAAGVRPPRPPSRERVTSISAGRTSSQAERGSSCPTPSRTSSCAPGMAAASASPCAGGNIGSSEPCTTSTGTSISPSREAGNERPSTMKWLVALAGLGERS
jgi:hypothetical protein